MYATSPQDTTRDLDHVDQVTPVREIAVVLAEQYKNGNASTIILHTINATRDTIKPATTLLKSFTAQQILDFNFTSYEKTSSYYLHLLV